MTPLKIKIHVKHFLNKKVPSVWSGLVVFLCFPGPVPACPVGCGTVSRIISYYTPFSFPPVLCWQMIVHPSPTYLRIPSLLG